MGELRMGQNTTLPLLATLCATIAFLAPLPAAAQPPAQQPPAQPFSAQVAAIEAVERVYASHRRSDGAGPAAAREATEASEMAGIASAKASDTRRQCLALQELAGMPVTPRDVQEEIDRWARDSQDPARLKELFDALGGDPSRVAEGLARPLLAERRLRAWYAFNDAMHRETRRQAEAARDLFLVTRSNPEGAGLFQTLVFRTGERRATETCPEDQEAVMLSRDEMASLRMRMPAPGTIGPVEETQDDFRFLYTIASRPEEIEVRFLLFPKKSFSEWWAGVRNRFPDSPLEGFSGGESPYRLPAISAAPAALCDQWTPTTTTGAPTARYVPTAVWTGSEMIVWGGALPPTPPPVGATIPLPIPGWPLPRLMPHRPAPIIPPSGQERR